MIEKGIVEKVRGGRRAFNNLRAWNSLLANNLFLILIHPSQVHILRLGMFSITGLYSRKVIYELILDVFLAPQSLEMRSESGKQERIRSKHSLIRKHNPFHNTTRLF